MNPFNLSKYYDLLIASSLLFLSSLTSYFAYGVILKIEAPEHLLLNSITPGNQTYRVFQEDRCVGEFKTEARHDIDYYIVAKGEIRTIYGKVPSKATVALTVFFNPLGQLFDGKFEARFMQSTISAQTTGTNPIKASLRAEMMGKEYKHSLEIPGPILLEKTKDGGYRIQYPQLGKTNSSLLTPSLGSLYKKLSLNVVRVDQNTKECKDSSEINLTPTLIELDAKLSYWNSLIEAAIPKEKLHP